MRIEQALVASGLANAYFSWQKGGIENTNKLIRKYIPKGTDISTVTDKKNKDGIDQNKQKTKEKLKFYTPKMEFYK